MRMLYASAVLSDDNRSESSFPVCFLAARTTCSSVISVLQMNSRTSSSGKMTVRNRLSNGGTVSGGLRAIVPFSGMSSGVSSSRRMGDGNAKSNEYERSAPHANLGAARRLADPPEGRQAGTIWAANGTENFLLIVEWALQCPDRGARRPPTILSGGFQANQSLRRVNQARPRRHAALPCRKKEPEAAAVVFASWVELVSDFSRENDTCHSSPDRKPRHSLTTGESEFHFSGSRTELPPPTSGSSGRLYCCEAPACRWRTPPLPPRGSPG